MVSSIEGKLFIEHIASSGLALPPRCSKGFYRGFL
nr:MAG TPA: FAM150 family [Caudoviricetes sp.]